MFVELWSRRMSFKLPSVLKEFQMTTGTVKLLVSATVTLNKQIGFLPGLVATEITGVTKGHFTLETDLNGQTGER